MKLIEKNDGIMFEVRVSPRATRSGIVGEHDGALKVRIAAAPVDGAANAELIKVLAKRFGVAKSDIEIIGGQTSKNKTVRIANLSRSRFGEVYNEKSDLFYHDSL